MILSFDNVPCVRKTDFVMLSAVHYSEVRLESTDTFTSFTHVNWKHEMDICGSFRNLFEIEVKFLCQTSKYSSNVQNQIDLKSKDLLCFIVVLIVIWCFDQETKIYCFNDDFGTIYLFALFILPIKANGEIKPLECYVGIYDGIRGTSIWYLQCYRQCYSLSKYD